MYFSKVTCVSYDSKYIQNKEDMDTKPINCFVKDEAFYSDDEKNIKQFIVLIQLQKNNIYVRYEGGRRKVGKKVSKISLHIK